MTQGYAVRGTHRRLDFFLSLALALCTCLPACTAPPASREVAPAQHALRRFEVLLPRYYNDGRPIPQSLLDATLEELSERFGAVSCETQSIRGQWRHEGRLHSDELVRVFVDAPDEPASVDYFRAFKKRAAARFGQIEIWLVTFPVGAL